MGLINNLLNTMVEDNESAGEAQVEEQKEVITDIDKAIRSVIQKSQANNGLVKGLNEVCKSLDRKDALLCILAENCDEPKYRKTVSALAKAGNIPLIEVATRDELG